MKRPVPLDFDGSSHPSKAPSSSYNHHHHHHHHDLDAPSSPPAASILTRDKILARPPSAPKKSKRARSHIFSTDNDDDEGEHSLEDTQDSVLLLHLSPVIGEPLLVPDESSTSSSSVHHHDHDNNNNHVNLPPLLGPRRRLFHAFQQLAHDMPLRVIHSRYAHVVPQESEEDDDTTISHDEDEDNTSGTSFLMMPRLLDRPLRDDDSTLSDHSSLTERNRELAEFRRD